jgi:beta-N-acetylhexosaminidase
MAQKIADDAVTIVRESTQQNVRESRRLLPLPRTTSIAAQLAYHPAVQSGSGLLVLIFTDDIRGDNGHALVREVRTRVPDARVFYVDNLIAPYFAPDVLEAAVDAERIVAAVYAVPAAGRTGGADSGAPALENGPASVLASVIKAANHKTVVVALGNPYLIVQYPTVQNYICTFSNVPASEVSAVKLLFGEMPARGHLPVTIPGIANRVPAP